MLETRTELFAFKEIPAEGERVFAGMTAWNVYERAEVTVGPAFRSKRNPFVEICASGLQIRRNRCVKILLPEGEHR